MTSSKQGKNSAARRREQERQQRQHTAKTTTSQQNRNKRKSAKTQSSALLIGGIVILVALIVGVFVYLSHQSTINSTASNNANGNAALQAITSLSPTLLTQVGTGNAQNLLKPVQNATPLTGATGKPEFFYAGGEYCPYCAAQRWSIITALSRFGTFKNINTLTSSEGSYATFTFVNSSYTSQYIDFVPLELKDNNYNTLQTPTTAQNQLISTYDAPPYVSSSNAGAIPFIDIGNKYVSSGSYYDPTTLANLSWTDIATQVQDPNSTVAKGILGTANYLTAAICSATNNQPASVCSTAPVSQIEPTLAQAYHSNDTQAIALTKPLDMITPKTGLKG